MRIIPAIDIIDGKCVRLSKGDYSECSCEGRRNCHSQGKLIEGRENVGTNQVDEDAT